MFVNPRVTSATPGRTPRTSTPQRPGAGWRALRPLSISFAVHSRGHCCRYSRARSPIFVDHPGPVHLSVHRRVFDRVHRPQRSDAGRSGERPSRLIACRHWSWRRFPTANGRGHSIRAGLLPVMSRTRRSATSASSPSCQGLHARIPVGRQLSGANTSRAAVCFADSAARRQKATISQTALESLRPSSTELTQAVTLTSPIIRSCWSFRLSVSWTTRSSTSPSNRVLLFSIHRLLRLASNQMTVRDARRQATAGVIVSRRSAGRTAIQDLGSSVVGFII